MHSFGLTLSMPIHHEKAGEKRQEAVVSIASSKFNAVKPLATSEARAKQPDTANRQSPPKEVTTKVCPLMSFCLGTGFEADSGLLLVYLTQSHHDDKTHRSCDTKVGLKQHGSNASSHHRTQDHTPCLRSRLRTTNRR